VRVSSLPMRRRGGQAGENDSDKGSWTHCDRRRRYFFRRVWLQWWAMEIFIISQVCPGLAISHIYLGWEIPFRT
jgi:hypothetical protein